MVDDERQIHTSLRLRLGTLYRLEGSMNPLAALELIGEHRFDLCIVDIHMPELNGLKFIEAARERDPALGYIILSGNDSDENLRRAIPLQIFDFIPKPLPGHTGFEDRIPDWIDRTRARRRELMLAEQSQAVVEDLELARIERDVELTASEFSREALLQAANHLTTIQALLLNARHSLELLARNDPRLASIVRGLHEAQRITEGASLVAEGYFGSAYADRENSPALVDDGIKHAMRISLRQAQSEARRQLIDAQPSGRDLAVAGLSGIDFLLMLVPVLTQALLLTEPDTTLQVQVTEVDRLDEAAKVSRMRSFVWVNRRSALASNPGVLISVRSSAMAVEVAEAGAWLRGGHSPRLHVPSRGLVAGIQKAKGLLGISTVPKDDRFELVLVLPVQ